MGKGSVCVFSLPWDEREEGGRRRGRYVCYETIGRRGTVIR